MRQNAVSSAPQNDARDPERGDEGDDARPSSRTRGPRAARRAASSRRRVGNSCCRSCERPTRSSSGEREHPAGDEQRDQRDREDATAAGCRRPSPARPVRLSVYAFSPEPASGRTRSRRIGTAWRAGEPLSRRARRVRFGEYADPADRRSDRRPMARLTFRRLLLVGVAVAEQPPRTPSASRSAQLLPGGASSTPEPYSPPVARAVQLRRAGAAREHRPRRCPRRLRSSTPEPGRSEPVEEQALQADDTAAVRRHRRRRRGGPGRQRAYCAGGRTGGWRGHAGGGRPALPARARHRGSLPRRDRRGGPAAAPDRRGRHPGPARADRRGGRGAGRGRRGRRDRRLRRERVRRERVRRAGISEAERPLAEAGEGVAEGQEQAEAELEENAGPVDDGVSGRRAPDRRRDRGRGQPGRRRDARAGRPGHRGPRGRRRRHLRRRLADLVGRRRQAAVSGRRLGRSPNESTENLTRDSRAARRRSDAVDAGPPIVAPSTHATASRSKSTACPASSVSSSCWPAPAPPSPSPATSPAATRAAEALLRGRLRPPDPRARRAGAVVAAASSCRRAAVVEEPVASRRRSRPAVTVVQPAPVARGAGPRGRPGRGARRREPVVEADRRCGRGARHRGRPRRGARRRAEEPVAVEARRGAVVEEPVAAQSRRAVAGARRRGAGRRRARRRGPSEPVAAEEPVCGADFAAP